MLQKTYDKLTYYAHHPKAFWILGILSFAESSVSPIPPDVVLIPMMIGNRRAIVRITLTCIIASVIGGFLGYWIGYALFDTVGRYLVSPEALESYQLRFEQWGFWLISIKGFLPIPYKIVAIAAGLAKYDLGLFFAASVIARSSRFVMLAILIHYYGEEVKEFIDKNVRLVMIGTIIAIIGVLFLAKLF